MENYKARREATIEYLASHKHLFDRINKDGTGGRVSFFDRMPRDYDNKACLPWSEVRGRYWYPWK
jgi:hypothetical protein